MAENKDVRVRFAPSPTGSVHIGNIRAAIFNWLFARHHGGSYVVRIEDTDRERFKQEYVDAILDALEWLELQSDEPLVYQSQRTDMYQECAHELLENGQAYPCFCEPKEADKVVADLEHGVASKYDGTCRDKTWTADDLKRPHAIRFKLPTDKTTVSFDDVIRGQIAFDTRELDDFVIIRRDGMPTYNFCVVIDDSDMRISHVIRGEDHISNTPKQILMYEAMNRTIPRFAHLPLILGSAGNKLSKRDAAVSVAEYREQGYLPAALCNYLVRLGWAHGDQEVFSKDEMVKLFTLEKVGKKGAIFDIQKLSWMNGVYLRNLKCSEFLENVAALGKDCIEKLTDSWNERTINILFELYKERATTVKELAENINSFAQAPKTLEVGLIKKWVTDQTEQLLQSFVSKISEMEELQHDTLLQLARELSTELGVKLVALAQPIRLALTGGIASPGVFELMEVLPVKEVCVRIENLITQLA